MSTKNTKSSKKSSTPGKHYLAATKRFSKGDAAIFTAGRGGKFTGKVTGIDPKTGYLAVQYKNNEGETMTRNVNYVGARKAAS